MSDTFLVGQRDESDESSGIGWWIFVIILGLLFIVVVVVLFVFLFRREVRKLLSVTGVEFNVPADGTIEAAWTGTGNANDELVLYVAPANETMKFSTDGAPEGRYLNSGSPSPSSPGNIPTTIAASARLARVTGLKAGNYIASLVVINPKDIPGQSNTISSKSLPVKTEEIAPVFFITTGKMGAVRYEPSSTQATDVGYVTSEITPTLSKFHLDSDGYLCAAGSGSWTASSSCGSSSRVLYGDLTNNEVKINRKGTPGATTSSSQPITTGNGEWVYTNGKLCLKSNSTNCMNLPSFPETSGEIGLEKIEMSTSTDATKWTLQKTT
jgi:hypothetical protein